MPHPTKMNLCKTLLPFLRHATPRILNENNPRLFKQMYQKEKKSQVERQIELEMSSRKTNWRRNDKLKDKKKNNDRNKHLSCTWAGVQDESGWYRRWCLHRATVSHFAIRLRIFRHKKAWELLSKSQPLSITQPATETKAKINCTIQT